MSAALVLFEVADVALERDTTTHAPRISDVTLGRMLGYDRERKVRELIERNLVDFPWILRRPTMGRQENAANLPEFYTVDEYSLSIVDALRLVERSEAPNRAEVLAKLTTVVETLVARGLDHTRPLRPARPPKRLPLPNGRPKNPPTLTRDELRAAVDRLGSVSAAARAWNSHRTTLHRYLAGTREVAAHVAQAVRGGLP